MYIKRNMFRDATFGGARRSMLMQIGAPPSCRVIPRTECSNWEYILLGLYSLSHETSYPKISWRLEAARLYLKMNQSLWNLTGGLAMLPSRLPNFKAIGSFSISSSQLRGFTVFWDRTSYGLVNRGPMMYLGLRRDLARYHFINCNDVSHCKGGSLASMLWYWRDLCWGIMSALYR